MPTTKILLNSVISTKDALFMTEDIKDFYLNTPMDCPEYIQLKLADMPNYFIALYNLNQLITTGRYVFVLVQKEMYSLPQAGIIAQKLLKQPLAKKGYRQSNFTPGFWKHD
ncbi:hypothetical protein ACHAW6_001868, partial [Cyclotella cf. meneghiniana]